MVQVSDWEDVSQGIKEFQNSQELNLLNWVLKTKAKADKYSLLARRKSEGVSKHDYKVNKAAMDKQVAAMLSDPQAISEILDFQSSDSFLGLIKEEYRKSGFDESQCEAMVNYLRNLLISIKENEDDIEGGYKAAYELPKLGLKNRTAQNKYTEMRCMLPGDTAVEEAEQIYSEISKKTKLAPAFNIQLHMRERLQKQVGREPHPSDEADIVNICLLPYVDYVCTYGEMFATYGKGPASNLKGKLFKRNNLIVMLEEIQTKVNNFEDQSK